MKQLKLKFKKSNLWVGILFFSLIFLLKIPFLNLPLHLDEISFYGGVSTVLRNNFNPFVESWWGYHPPFIYELAAIIEYFFGFSRIALRLMVLAFSFLTLWFTFLLGKTLFNREIGFMSALLLFATPLFFVQSGLFHLAIPLASLSLMSLYFYFKNSRIGYFIAGSLLLLTKETGVFIIAAIALYELLKRERRRKLFPVIKRLIFLSLPLVPFVIWLGLNKYFYDWFVWPIYKNFLFFSANKPWQTGSIIEKISITFFFHWRWLISLALLVGIFSAIFNKKLRKKFWTQQFFFLFSLPLVVFLFFSPGLYLPRYILFVYPLLLIAFVFCLKELVRKKQLYFLLVLLIVILFVRCWFNYPPKEVIWGGEMNLAYLDVVKAHQAAADFLQRKYPNSRILTSDTMAIKFRNPIYGYVSEELNAYNAEKILERTELLVIPSYLRVLPSTQRLLKLRDELNPPLLKVISFGGEEVLIYKLQ
ncbi:glycosyltransferase family 39 protein [Patescibacteria group bacterium]|nr:glycosyltransferase family 39 protein [Patescibacteria group bacterium]